MHARFPFPVALHALAFAGSESAENGTILRDLGETDLPPTQAPLRVSEASLLLKHAAAVLPRSERW